MSPFLTVFSKDLHCRQVKTRACLGKGCDTIILLSANAFNFDQSENLLLGKGLIDF